MLGHGLRYTIRPIANGRLYSNTEGIAGKQTASCVVENEPALRVMRRWCCCECGCFARVCFYAMFGALSSRLGDRFPTACVEATLLFSRSQFYASSFRSGFKLVIIGPQATFLCSLHSYNLGLNGRRPHALVPSSISPPGLFEVSRA